MKVLVIGAAGKTGRAVVEQSLAAGHEVTAFIHSEKNYNVENVKVLTGDAGNLSTMERAVSGQDVVIDTLGGKTPYKSTVLESSSAKNIIQAMQNKGIKKLFVISMVGIGESGKNTSLFVRLLLLTFLRGAKKDKAAMDSAVKASNLDWLIVRPAVLTDDEAVGNIKIFDSNTKDKANKISRKNVAGFLVAQISDDKYSHQAVTIATS